MEVLKKQRGVIKGKLTRCKTFLDNSAGNSSVNSNDIITRLEGLDIAWSEFQDIQLKILDLTPEAQVGPEEVDFAEFEEKFFNIKSGLRGLLPETNSSQVNSTPVNPTHENPHSATKADVKLPRMDLPTFNGNQLQWQSFSDLFKSIVHNNNTICDAQKLHYLKNSLLDEAKALLDSVDITDANYALAWSLLEERFQNERQLILCHLKKLMSQPNVNSESAANLRNLLDTTTKHVRALNTLSIPTQHWDHIIVFIIIDKLDHESRKQWELHSPGKTFPTLESVREFLEQRCRALEATSLYKSNSINQVSTASHKAAAGSKGVYMGSTSEANLIIAHPSTYSPNTQRRVESQSCPLCKELHNLFHCPNFATMDVKERSSQVKQFRLCFNCLRPGHSVSNCKSNSSCRQCNKRHNTLLHWNTTTAEAPATAASLFSHQKMNEEVLLNTAVVRVKDVTGTYQPCRVLLDNGSQANIISEAFAQRLGYPRNKSAIEITGIGNSESRTRGTMRLTVESRVSSFKIEVQAIIMTRLTSILPNSPIKSDGWSFLENLNLADPTYNRPGEIDMILGAEQYEDILVDGYVRTETGRPNARNSQFGWILSGKVEVQVNTLRVHVSTVDVSDQLKMFWNLEELHPQQHLTKEEKECESFFRSSHSRDATGRFITPLPFKTNLNQLGQSKSTCMRRLQSIERKLDRSPEHRELYNDFMGQYLSLGHMEKIPPEEQKEEVGKTNYLPHHFVLKDESQKSKFRVVFDASMRTSTGTSLNDVLMVGETVQDDLHTIISRFRLPKFVFTADIAKMYRQMKVPKKDSDLQRILWRWDAKKPVDEFRLKTVTYGTSAAPFLATRALQQLFEDEGEQFPLAKEIASKQFYVDDVMAGHQILTRAVEAQRQLIEMCKRAGFQLRKWSANHPMLLENIPMEDRETSTTFKLDQDEKVKTLGLQWNPVLDCFSFKVKSPSVTTKLTKRIILSETAKLFDPLGWLAPVIISSKILLQKLWLTGIGWDDPLPTELEAEFVLLKDQAVRIQEISIPRHIGGCDDATHELHGFCDASENAYAAVLYLRVQEIDRVSIQLITSKTRVAPVKQVSLPKLELCGATLLSKLIKKVTSTFPINLKSVMAWSDSTITLDWISHCPKKWETFVANRVSDIQSIVPPESWGFVPGKENPADCASRGIPAESLINHALWWTGPPWLKLSNENWPRRPTIQENTVGLRKLNVLTVQVGVEWELIEKFSSITRLQRVTAFCLRFISNARKPKGERNTLPLSPLDLQQALNICIKQIQRRHFSEILDSLEKKTELPQLHSNLSPFIDETGLLRVGGRLTHSNLPFNAKHPILIPKNHKLTRMIITAAHIKHLHAGAQLTLAAIQQQYWIVNGKQCVKNIIFKCVTCRRDRGNTQQQYMGDLPSYRVQPGRPFLKTGVDYGGPFLIKSSKGRGGKIIKCYICLFVCVSTKAVHLEAASDLTSEAFIAAMRRFIARRGKPLDMFSDNGTNFVGADVEMKKLMHLINSQPFNSQMADTLAGDGITWNFIPAKAPHFGGLWESGIKSTKGHLRRVVGQQSLTFEEMTTFLAQVEACLNSRPICSLTTDPNDLSPLTPGHFLIGGPLTSAADPDLSHLNVNRLGRWQLVQNMTQQFWKRWNQEYLVQLQQRHKWTEKVTNAKIGDIVLIKEDNIPPLKWPMGRIETVYPGKDNIVRTVLLKTSSGMLKRPVVKLCFLPVNDDNVEHVSS